MGRIVRSLLTENSRLMYKRIKKTHSRAKLVGMFYWLALIELTILAVLPTLNVNYVNVFGETTKLWTDWNATDASIKLGLNMTTVSRVLYAVMLLVLLVNFLRSFRHLSWLYSTRGSRTYGFNRNVYAMQSLGKLFSSTFATIIICNACILLIHTANATDQIFVWETWQNLLINDWEQVPRLFSILFSGFFNHFFCGMLGTKVSLFETKPGRGLVEVSRVGSRFPALFRNFLQIGVSLVLMMCLFRMNVLVDYARYLLEKTPTEVTILKAILQAGLLLCWLVLIVHATNVTEYNNEGAHAKGMKNFKVFIFFTAGLWTALYFLGGYKTFDMNDVEGMTVLVAAASSLVMFFVELLMRNMPACTPIDSELSTDETNFLLAHANPYNTVSPHYTSAYPWQYR